MGLDISVYNKYEIEILDERLGNVGQISRIDEILSRYPDLFSKIREKVSYSGAHCCDEIALDEIGSLLTEVELLLSFSIEVEESEKLLISRFAEKLKIACLLAIENETEIRF